VAALLSSFVALVFLIFGMLLIYSMWWLIPIGIIIHVAGQQEVLSAQYFSIIQEYPVGRFANSPLTIPLEQVAQDAENEIEPNFNGMIWNERNRLWIVYRDGHPVSANALVGDK
jgi:hypothetical protein